MRSLSHCLLAAPLAHLLAGCAIIGPVDSDSASDSGSSGGSTTATAGTTDATTGGATEGSASGTDSATGSTTAQPTSTSATTGEPGSTGATTSETTGGAAGEPSKFSEACAPNDGPATEFKIGLALRECTSDFPEDAPLFRIVLFQGPPLAPGEYKLDGGLGFAYLDTGNGMPVTGDVGTLTVVTQTADGLQGTYDVTLSDNTNLAGEFDAIYCPMDVLCG